MSNYNCNHLKGIICTRYSELLRCTTGQIDQVLWERQHPEARASTEHMSFGTVRHALFQEEAERTGKLPACFGIDRTVDYIEQEFTTEAFPGVVVHSRPDVVSIGLGSEEPTIYDYKTVVDGKQGWKAIVDSYQHESKRRQMIWYAWQLGLHGIPITRLCYLLEIWNTDRDTILGYEVIESGVSFKDMAAVVLWAKKRVSLLQAVLAEEASSH